MVANDAVDAVPVRFAVIVPALKFPNASRETIVVGVLASVIDLPKTCDDVKTFVPSIL